ncbi:hypothetical protein Ancab_036591 [Ancistrocladus abbreviatus]
MESPRKDRIPISIKPHFQRKHPLTSDIIAKAADDAAQEQSLPFFSSPSKNRENTWIISLFVLLHFFTFIATMFVNDCSGNSHGDCAFSFLGRMSFQPLSENPLLGPSSSTLDKVGALRQKFLANNHQIRRLFTCPWLHAGAFPLILNLGSVIFIGIRLEQKFGPWRVGIIYILSAFTGTLMAALFIRNSPATCSSGALFGLTGATFSGLIRNWKLYSDKIVALAVLFCVSAINFVFGLLPYIDNFANVGGFVSGFLLGFVLSIPQQLRKAASHEGIFDYGAKSSTTLKQKLDRPVLRSISLLLFCIIVAGLLASVLHGMNVGKYCSWCQYIDCVPSKRWICDIKPDSCKATASGGQLTVTCTENDNFRILPYTDISRSRMEDLCNLICS